jgi:DNA integrity scanning protein DisA with diadenylate cyclase activity
MSQVVFRNSRGRHRANKRQLCRRSNVCELAVRLLEIESAGYVVIERIEVTWRVNKDWTYNHFIVAGICYYLRLRLELAKLLSHITQAIVSFLEYHFR